MGVLHVRTEPGDGLEALVNRAARAAQGEALTPVGVLGIVLDDPAAPDLLVEAAFAMHDGKRVVDRLDARVRLLDHTASRELVLRALEEFGGRDFTSLTAAPRGGSSSSAFDVTLSFSGRLRWRGINTLLPPGNPTPEERELYGRLLDTLGVRHRDMVASHAQLRARPTPAQQAEAFDIAASAGYRTTLYAATLPTTCSMQVEQGSEAGKPYLDCFIGHGLSPDVFCSPSDAAHIERFLKEHLEVELADRRYAVTNVYGDASEGASAAPSRSLPWPLRGLGRGSR